MRVVLLELVGQSESDDWQTGVVFGTVLTLLVRLGLLMIVEVALLTVDVTDTSVPSGRFQAAAEQSGIGKTVFLHVDQSSCSVS